MVTEKERNNKKDSFFGAIREYKTRCDIESSKSVMGTQEMAD